jgi:hypothetical protein
MHGRNLRGDCMGNSLKGIGNRILVWSDNFLESPFLQVESFGCRAIVVEYLTLVNHACLTEHFSNSWLFSHGQWVNVVQFFDMDWNSVFLHLVIIRQIERIVPKN